MSDIQTIPARFPKYISWRIELGHRKDPLFPFSRKSRSQIRATQRRLEDNHYFFKTEPVTKMYIGLFEPLYQLHMKTIGGIAYDIRQKILIYPPHSFPYYAISLYHEEELIGGLLFSDRAQYVSAAYKAFPHTLPINLPTSVSYIADSLLNTYALDHGYTYIVQGRDRNLYGIHDAIGLASYKLRIGCFPYVSKSSKAHSAEKSFTWNGKDDVYVLLWPEKRWQITDALLVSAEKDREKLQSKYPVFFTDTAPKVQFYN